MGGGRPPTPKPTAHERDQEALLKLLRRNQQGRRGSFLAPQAGGGLLGTTAEATQTVLGLGG